MNPQVDILTQKLALSLGYLNKKHLDQINNQRKDEGLETFLRSQGLLTPDQITIIREIRWEWLVGKSALELGLIDPQELTAYIREKVNRIKEGEHPGFLLLSRGVLSRVQIEQSAINLFEKGLMNKTEYDAFMNFLSSPTSKKSVKPGNKKSPPKKVPENENPSKTTPPVSDPVPQQSSVSKTTPPVIPPAQPQEASAQKTHSSACNTSPPGVDPYVLASLSVPETKEERAAIVIEDLEDRIRLGDQIGNYLIKEKIGVGGMGSVYKGYHTLLKKDVAIKVIKQGAGVTKEIVERFIREARLAAQLSHPNIVTLHDIEENKEKNFYYIVMDYIDGVSISKYFADKFTQKKRRKSSKLPKTLSLSTLLSEKLTAMEKVCNAIDYAHERGIVHRDIKPENILVDKKGEPYIMDFGLAKNIGEDDNTTKAGQIMGTPRYMAPEQAKGISDKIDARTDVYSLGAVLYELLTGKTVVDGENTINILYNVCRMDPIPLRELDPSIPKEVESICLKALEKKKGKRYQTAKEMANDIRRFLNDEVVRAEAPTLTYKIGKAARKAMKHQNPMSTMAIVLPVVALCLLGILILIKIETKNPNSIKPAYVDKKDEKENHEEKVEKKNGQEKTDTKTEHEGSKPDNKQVENTKVDNNKVKTENNGQAVVNGQGSQKTENGVKTEHNPKPGEKVEDNGKQRNGKEDEENEKMAKFHKERGGNHYLRREYDQAIAEFTKAINYNPSKDSQIYNNRGVVYYIKKQYEQAIVDFANAININPNNEMAYENRGSAYYELNRFNEALEDYKTAIKINPKHPRYYYHLAKVLVKTEQYEKALENYSKAIHYNPSYFEAYNDRGYLYSLQKRYQSALEDCSKAISINPQNIDSYCTRGTVYIEMNKPELAIKDFEKIISMNPNHKVAQEWLEKLQK